MYASVNHQVYELAHFSFSFLLLMVAVPRLLFGTLAGDRGERLVALCMRIVFVYIVVGYLLVLLKLFEVLGIVAVLFLLLLAKYVRRYSVAARERVRTAATVVFYETLDAGVQGREWLRRGWRSVRRRFWNERWRGWVRGMEWVPTVLLLVVLGLSAYVRFDDAWLHAAPAMSDGYVTLAWMKYISRRVLFHDGIYPQGFHIVLACLQKFAAIDPLYVLKYDGPLNGVLIGAGLYVATSRWTGNHYAGIAAAAIYGLAGESLHGEDWVRQASTNSQEFAMVFVFPTFYFLTGYLRDGTRGKLWTAAAGVSLIGLVHALAFGYVGLGLGVMIVLWLSVGWRRYRKRVLHLIGLGVAAVVMAVLPLGLGKLLGREVHAASADFLESKAMVSPPSLHLWDIVALVALVPALLSVLLSRKPREEKLVQVTAILIVGATFLLYKYGGMITQSLMLATRMPSLWAMAVPVAVGMGLCGGWQLFRPVLEKWRLQGWLEAATCLTLVVFLAKGTTLAPIVPYKMEWESGVQQYLRIAEEHRPKTWMIVSQNEGYALVLGNGYHLYLGDFVKMYDPAYPALTKKGETKPDKSIPPDVYVYNERQVFEVSKSNAVYSLLAPVYAARKVDNANLDEWMATYKAHHGAVEIQYEDAHLRIYHLHREEDPEEKKLETWGGG